MTIRRRTVTGNIQKGDAPWEGAEVHFRLTAGSFTAVAQFPREVVTATTDEAGDFSISLWCDEDGLIATRYGCWLPDNPKHATTPSSFEFDLDYGDGSPVSVEAKRAEEEAGDTPENEAMLQAIVDAHAAAVETIYTETFDTDGVLDIGSALRAVVFIDSSAGDVTVTLPPAADAPRAEIIFKKIADGNLGIVDGAASETIDGQLVYNLEMNNQTVKIVAVGDAWYIV